MSHEPDVIAGRPVAKIAVGAMLVLALSVVAALALLSPAAAETPRIAPLVIGSIETTPILDGDRGRHIAAAQRAELERGRWVDRDAGIVDLPLDLAIDRLLAQDGGAP
jgi:hypothetical protein